MKDLVIINGREVERITYKDNAVLTYSMIDELHQRPKGTAPIPEVPKNHNK